MPIDGDSLSLLVLGSVFKQEGKGSMSTCFCETLKHFAASTPPLPIIPFDIVAYAFVGQAVCRLLTKLVRSRWLNIGLILFFFCMFMDRDGVEVHKHAKKNRANIQTSVVS